MNKLKKFIIASNIKHNNKYDYSLVCCIGREKIQIICPHHGVFEQSPKQHLKTCGCRKCSNTHGYSTGEFIQRAKEKHGSKYDYSKINYTNARTKVIIICPKHGEFEQIPRGHILGKGCPTCGGSEKLTKHQFLTQADKKHKSKYDYSKTNYINARTKVIIVCPKHGEFEQVPFSHLIGKGCSACSGNKKLTTKEFTQKANFIHNNKYDYSMVNYKTNKKNVIIICFTHGQFEQTPDNHLSGRGCPHCTKSISKLSQQWLDKLNVKIREFKIPYTNYKVDGYDQETNTAYEFYGDMWHGNPLIYKRDDINPVNKKPCGQLYDETIKRENILKLMGYKIITIWESDWLN
jgi:hypothetical protein